VRLELMRALVVPAAATEKAEPAHC
jgi:hypothetical protein